MPQDKISPWPFNHQEHHHKDKAHSILAEYLADREENDNHIPSRFRTYLARNNDTDNDIISLTRDSRRRPSDMPDQNRPFQLRRLSSTRRQPDNHSIPHTFLILDDQENGQLITPEPQTNYSRPYQSRTISQPTQQWQNFSQPFQGMRRLSTSGRRTSTQTNNLSSFDEVVDDATGQNIKESRAGDRTGLKELRQQALKYSRDLNTKRKRKKAKTSPNRNNAPASSDEELRKENMEDGDNSQLSKLATQLYTLSWLIFFAILGTLARLGVEAIAFYPGAPVVFSELWANFGGSLFMGFLIEDRMLFRDEWGTPVYDNEVKRAAEMERNLEAGTSSDAPIDLAAAKKAHVATKKTIPLYIGLATGFCGSFTTFGSFMQDCFLALSNDLPTPLNHPEDQSASTGSTVPRNGGYSFMAVTAVILVTVALCMSALFVGAHLALFTSRFIPTMPFRITRSIIDPLGVVLGFGSWIGAVLMAIFPPDSDYASSEKWRGQALFAICFAPVGCLLRFYISLLLNSKIPSFPLGTFLVNVFGTMILGMSWDLQHVPLGGVVGCQVLQGIEAGFCGCLTTVSTWVSELSSLKKRHAYRYGFVTVFVSLASLVAIMGSLKWTRGFSDVQCTT